MDNSYLAEILVLISYKTNRSLNTWRSRSQLYWLWRLLGEIFELALSLVGLHKHSPEQELDQIAAICMNWLDMLLQRKDE